MIEIVCYKGTKKKMLKHFEDEQWPIAFDENYKNNPPKFRTEKYTIIATLNSRIVGCIFLKIDTGVADMDSLLVHDELRREGIGTLLLQKAEITAKEKGCHLIKLETGDDWNARKFYEKHGYSLRATLKNYYGKKDFVLMDKLL